MSKPKLSRTNSDSLLRKALGWQSVRHLMPPISEGTEEGNTSNRQSIRSSCSLDITGRTSIRPHPRRSSISSMGSEESLSSFLAREVKDGIHQQDSSQDMNMCSYGSSEDIIYNIAALGNSNSNNMIGSSQKDLEMGINKTATSLSKSNGATTRSKNGFFPALPKHINIQQMNFSRPSKERFVPPSFDKSESEMTFIASHLSGNFLFQSLPESALDVLIEAFEKVEYPPFHTIIMQGNCQANYFYLLGKGECTVTINGKTLPEPYGTLRAGAVFGELALLYNKPRAATILTKDSVELYRVDSQTFQRCIDLQKIQELKEDIRQVDETLDRVAGVNTRYDGSIIHRFKPKRSWLLRKWKGTVLQYVWKQVALNMLFALVLTLSIHYSLGQGEWELGLPPDANHPVISRMIVFGSNWNYLMTLTTFILTFFLGQAYTLWTSIYWMTRKTQGRICDCSMILAVHAKRNKDTGEYTPEATALLDEVATYAKLFHVFMWAQFASNLSPLLSHWGMLRMVSYGLLTKRQFDILRKTCSAGPHYVCLEWMTIRALAGTKEGTLENDTAMKQVFLDKIAALRSTCAEIPDALDGRMPLAYTHIVQLLVDTFLITAPITLYASLGIWSVLYVGILTLFYSGLLDLAKMLIDPLDNDDFYTESVNMDIGVLVRETNADTLRYKTAASALPFKCNY